MWVFTTDGFFSAVQKPGDPNVLTVRSRTREDAEDLAERFGLTVQHTPDGDYAYRVVVPRAKFAEYVAEAARGIDYSNFKDAVAERQGHDRARIYADVWAAVLRLQWRPWHASVEEEIELGEDV